MNQLASEKASRSAAIAPCVVVKPDMFAAAHDGQHRSVMALTSMGYIEPWRNIRTHNDNIIKTALSVPTDWFAISRSRSPPSSASPSVSEETTKSGGGNRGDVSVRVGSRTVILRLRVVMSHVRGLMYASKSQAAWLYIRKMT
jgi:hypothetical protein